MTSKFPQEKQTGQVLYSVTDGIGQLTINNPARRNMMDLAMRDVFHDHLADAVIDDAVRVIIISGQGDHFCAGGDISGMRETALQCRARLKRLHRIVKLIAYAEKPIISACEGFVAGNGLSIAAASDVVVTARDAKFICSFVKIGLIPDTAALWFLPQRMGLGRAKLAMMSAAPLSGAEAVRAGLGDIETEPGKALARAQEIAAGFMSAGPLAVGMTKAILARAPMSLEEALNVETESQAVLFTSDDFAEGKNAFLEKRKAEFQGK